MAGSTAWHNWAGLTRPFEPEREPLAVEGLADGLKAGLVGGADPGTGTSRWVKPLIPDWKKGTRRVFEGLLH